MKILKTTLNDALINKFQEFLLSRISGQKKSTEVVLIQFISLQSKTFSRNHIHTRV